MIFLRAIKYIIWIATRKNDDFENLITLTVKDHYALHFDLLHDSARESNQKRKAEGIPHGNKGHIMITNGIENHWIDENDKIPEKNPLKADR